MAKMQSKPRGRNRGRKQGKEVEMDVELKNINKADLPHVLTKGSNNDPSWYTNIAPLVKDYASFSFNQANGLFYNPLKDIENPNIAVLKGVGANFTPAMLVADILPTIGKSDLPTSAPNIAAQQLYTLVRKANSGAANYDKTDLMMYILAMDSAYMLYEELVRAYRLLGKYNYMNRYFPDSILKSLGFSSDLGDNLSDFRGILDLFAYQLASLNIPDQLAIIRRHSWMFSNIYTDAQSIKSQLYAFKPAGYYVWTEGTAGQKTYLNYVTRTDLYTSHDVVDSIGTIRGAINTIMQPLLGSEDVGNMSGDMQKAFGDGGMIKIRSIGQYESLEPVFSREVLLQFSGIHQAMWVVNSSLDITVDLSSTVSGPFIKQNVSISTTGNLPAQLQCMTKPLLNYIDMDPSPELNMVATRLMAGMPSPAATGTSIPLESYGTEIVTGLNLCYNTGVANNVMYSTNPVAQVNILRPGDLGPLANISLLQKFDWAPNFSLWWAPGTGDDVGTVTYSGNIADYCNYRFMESDELRRLHETAVMSEFAVQDYNYQI